MSEPANKADIQRVTEAVESMGEKFSSAMEQNTAALRDFVEQIERHREPAAPAQPSATGGNVKFSINMGGLGVAISAAAVLVVVVAVILQGQRMSDNQAAAMREIDRLERQQELHAEWSRQESSILRGYVWTGKVPVANPYPKQEPKK